VDIDAPAVRVMTVHKAKGLEFPVVFVVGLVQGRFPWPSRGDVLGLPDTLRTGHRRWISGSREERRLFYVAMTRAEEALHLTWAHNYGGRRTRKPSQFVLEALDLAGCGHSPRRWRRSRICAGSRRRPSPARPEPPLGPDVVLTLSHRQSTTTRRAR
jgi:DNA helicase-2/ATP-dependent DNA helicase PcrA